MNRPRESVLSLFDPLASSNGVATPPHRDVHTPDSGSDKENNLPAASSYAGDSPITLTKFFSRTYTRYKTLPAKLPKGGLIDFGDITIDEDAKLADCENVEAQDEEEMSEDVSETDENTPPASAGKQATPHRRPLADIAIEDDENTPMALNRGLDFLKPNEDTIPAPVFAQSKPTAAPVSSPLAAVINSINGTEDPSISTSSPPRISVIPPEPSSPSPRGARSRPANATSTSSLDPRRGSVDLQSSFSMQLQCGDSSFDLLSDKISFAGHETFLGAMDDFDLAAEEATMLALAQKLESVSLKEKSAVRRRAMQRMALTDSESESETEVVSSLAERIRDVKLAMSDSESEDEHAPPAFTPKAERQPHPRLASKSAEATPQATGKRQARLMAKNASPPVCSPELSVKGPAETVSNPTLITPKNVSAVPKNPPAIAALRIVKKAAIRPHERIESISTSSTSSGSSAGLTTTVASSSSSVSPVLEAPAVPLLTSRMSQPAPRPTRTKALPSSVPPPQPEQPAKAAVPEPAKAEPTKAPSRTKSVLVGSHLRGPSAFSTDMHGRAAEASSTRYTGAAARAASSRTVAGVQRPGVPAAPEVKTESSREGSAPISTASKLRRTTSVSATLSRRAAGPASVTSASSGTAAKLLSKPSTTSMASGLRPPSRFGVPAPSVAPAVSARPATMSKATGAPISRPGGSSIARTLRGEGRFKRP